MCCIGPVEAVGTGMQEQEQEQKREARVGGHPLKPEYLEQRAEQSRAGQSARRATVVWVMRGEARRDDETGR